MSWIRHNNSLFNLDMAESISKYTNRSIKIDYLSKDAHILDFKDEEERDEAFKVIISRMDPIKEI